MRQDQFLVSLRINNRDIGTWDKKSGGKIAGNVTKYREGGGGPTVALGGAKTTEDITLTRLYKRERDHLLLGFLKSVVGKGACVVSQQPLDGDGNAFGRPIVYNGVLSGLDLPEADSNSEDPALIVLEIGVQGDVG